MEHQYVLAAKREKEEQDADYADNNLKPPATTGQSAAVINPTKQHPRLRAKARK